MFLKLFLLFTLVPVLELFVLIKVGSIIGPLVTIGIVVLTGVVGAALARAQGLQVMLNLQRGFAAGQAPTTTVVEGVLIFIGGITLLTPGFITDAMGLCLLLPATRQMIARAILAYVQRQIQLGNLRVATFGRQDDPNTFEVH